jgi:hypothetical protein
MLYFNISLVNSASVTCMTFYLANKMIDDCLTLTNERYLVNHSYSLPQHFFYVALASVWWYDARY